MAQTMSKLSIENMAKKLPQKIEPWVYNAFTFVDNPHSNSSKPTNTQEKTKLIFVRTKV